MNFYRVSQWANSEPVYSGTLGDAHLIMRSYPVTNRDEARVELIDIGTDKDALLRILNSGPPVADAERTWIITPRGGLKEVPNGE